MPFECPSRRSLLATVARASAAASTGMFPTPAAAQVPGSRAAVCIFLLGGNDSNNMVVPMDSAAYGAYATGRGPLAIPRSALVPVNGARQNALFGLHPSLKDLAKLYNRGNLAVLANTGRLDSQSLTSPRPQAGAAFAGPYSYMDSLNAVCLRPGILSSPWSLNLQPADAAGPQVLNFGGVTMLSAARLNLSGSLSDNPSISATLAKTSLRTAFPNSVLGSQLLRIAKLLRIAPSLGVNRPVFTAVMGGWNTRTSQLARQSALLAILNQAMNAFYSATEELGIADQVVTYTSTECSRTLKPNANLGSDAAWGGHELVMGASVRGGDLYGKFPALSLGGPSDFGTAGAWIPTTANAQYDATIAYWHGVSAGALSATVPGVSAFPEKTLGFLG